jgi:hypothetical protein
LNVFPLIVTLIVLPLKKTATAFSVQADMVSNGKIVPVKRSFFTLLARSEEHCVQRVTSFASISMRA